MQEWLETIRRTIAEWNPSGLPPFERIVAAMDPVAWTLLALFVGAVVLGVFFSVSTRRSFLRPDEVETTPTEFLARLKQDPTQTPPVTIVSRLGAEATLELLEYGDAIQTKEWRYRWGRVREELLILLSQQNAFGPTNCLARYYCSADVQEPETLRIRRTALIHKLGRARRIDPDPVDGPAQLRIRCHPAEVQSDLGFAGPTVWLMTDEPAPAPDGPLVEMEPVEFRSLQDAEVRLHIRRSPVVGGGFHLRLRKRRNYWVVVDEEIEWVS
jgi:hypothetical protein